MDGQTYTAHFEAPNGEPILKAYPDPKTHNAPFTIGLGHTQASDAAATAKADAALAAAAKR